MMAQYRTIRRSSSASLEPNRTDRRTEPRAGFSRVSHNSLWPVRFLEVLHLLVGQGLPVDGDGLLQTAEIAEPDDGDCALLDDPGERDVAHFPAVFVGEFLDALDDVGVLFVDAAEHGVALHALLAGRRSGAQRPGQQAAVQGRPGDQADAGLVAEGVHLALLFAVAERVVVLHGDELGPAVDLGDVLHLRELVRPH